MSLRVVLRAWAALFAVVAFACLTSAGTAAAGTLKPSSSGELDCNGQSTQQRAVNMRLNCTDIRGYDNEWNRNTWSGRFYDNGYYVGHDEPDMTFLSDARGSGSNVTWSETLPLDPSAAPTVSTPGSDVNHWFELSVAPWFSMAMCDSKSYPLKHCEAQSDSNAPTCVGTQITGCNPGGGSAFMEMQLYPPGMPPFAGGVSCDDTHWCAALNIDSLECTLGFAECNAACEEPVNFAFIQRNGVPTGPPSPQQANLASQTQNAETLMMNPGDQITVHMWDAPAPGGGHAFKVEIKDLTTGQIGYMQASAHNGFADTSFRDCSGTPHNFEPEYSTAAQKNIVPWAALETNISTQFEIGHFEACTSLTDASSIEWAPGVKDIFWNRCHGPYEGNSLDGEQSGEPSDAFCYPVGDTHGVRNTAPDMVTGCMDDFTQNGDLDFDGNSYWPDWPTGAQPTSTFPGSFVQQLPTTGGAQYASFFIQTDTALSEATCQASPAGCAIPAPGSPGNFYPYWTRVTGSATCTLEFGNVSTGAGANDFGGDAQYGTNQEPALGYPEFIGPVMNNACTSTST